MNKSLYQADLFYCEDERNMQPAAAKRDFVRDSNRGAGLAGVIIALLLLTVLGIGVASLIAIESSVGAGETRSRQALCMAESGIEYALWSLDQDTGWTPDPAFEYTVGSSTFTLERIDNPDGTNTIVSTGYVPNKTNSEAVRVVDITGEIMSPPMHPLYKYAFWVDISITLNYRRRSFTTTRDAPLDADFYARGNVKFSRGSDQKIQGTVGITGTATLDRWSGANPWMALEEGVEEIPRPVLDAAAEAWYEANAYAVYTGDQVFENVQINLGEGRLYLIKGNLTIGNVTIRGYGTGVATGAITVTGTITYDTVGPDLQGPLGLVAFGDIICDQDTDPLHASMYAGDQFRTSGGRTIEVFGSLGARRGLDWVNYTQINITYDNRLADDDPADNSLPVSAARSYLWREVYR